MASIHCSDMLLISIVLFITAAIFLHRRRRLPVMTPDLLLNIHRVHYLVINILTLSDGTFMLKGPWFANIDMLLTSDPANMNHMLSKNFHNYPKGPEFRNIFDVLGDGIFNSDHELWEIHRKTTMSLLKHPEFHTLLETNIKNKLEKRTSSPP
ncbi:putative cytochrome P450 superfamily [Helianthus anomalus]